ncbi:hypothetical protein TPHA_0C00310 [Tetrapisispora phaffii CBS 4417]|uniref:FAD-binding FR-type domain-containing protein n=1 Tax=Tetrapisispora phaffii (strain ATCC 24235 / CBS 4417 / NBRC 1672 / NRRL Y-8282 / UCD 70-5) TaxID=1071381 RepID=G8BR12_TETPH|nr:hypothetical protein TPHA_0C00310 [Tetrapisispora phaffii CBS 4417]CCE62188.1 hypothetical protein TPHA_0C00310 [Tetrapisispora phaffii CBS 4417]
MFLQKSFVRLYSLNALKSTSRFNWKRHKVIYGLSCGALSFSIYMAYNSLSRFNDSPNLSTDHFTKYRISYKKDIDEEHFLLELTPILTQNQNLWQIIGSTKIWSVEIKQPEIMVVRNYTPLPFYFDASAGQIQLLKDGENADGKLMFYLKQYKNGEVARWIHGLGINDTVELRGPYIEYEFPNPNHEMKRDRNILKDLEKTTHATEQKQIFKYEPLNILMFTAGTGVVPALQLLLTESPFYGTMHLFHSCKTKSELGPLSKYLDVLDKQNRIKLHMHESSKGGNIKDVNIKELLNQIPEPVPYKEMKSNGPHNNNTNPSLALVCGPDSFITTVAGEKYDFSQGPVGGLLKEKGWDNQNVYKFP